MELSPEKHQHGRTNANKVGNRWKASKVWVGHARGDAHCSIPWVEKIKVPI